MGARARILAIATIFWTFCEGGIGDAAAVNSLTVVIPRIDVATAGQAEGNPDLISWELYDDFSESSLNTALWGIEGNTGSRTTGSNGLTLSPTSATGPGDGDPDIGIRSLAGVPLGSYFAVRVPFLITQAIADASNSNVEININLCGEHTSSQCDSVGWVLANKLVGDGDIPSISGKYMFSGTDTVALSSVDVVAGSLALIYKDGFISNFVDDGSGWRQLGPNFLPPSEWTPMSIPLQFVVSSGIRIFPHVATVSEPDSGVLVLGVIGVLLLGHLSKRRRSSVH